jgi:hypothetical protein
MPDVFLPRETLDALTKGCLERKVIDVWEAIESEEGTKLLGDFTVGEQIGTFDKKAVFVRNDGRVMSAHFGESADGRIVLLRMEPEDQKGFTESSTYMADQAKKYVDAWMSARPKESLSRLQELIPLVDSTSSVTQEKVVEGVELFMGSDRQWTKLLRENREKLAKKVGLTEESIFKLDKFRQLYEAKLPSTELESYRSLVLSDLKILKEHVDLLSESVDSSLTAFRKVAPALMSKDEAIGVFDKFASEYQRDLRAVSKSLSESTERIGKVDLLAKVYDLVTERISDFDAAGRFVETMSRRLVEASTEVS